MGVWECEDVVVWDGGSVIEIVTYVEGLARVRVPIEASTVDLEEEADEGVLPERARTRPRHDTGVPEVVADELGRVVVAQEADVGVEGAPGRVENAREGLLNVGAGVAGRAPLEVGQTSVVAQGGDDLLKRVNRDAPSHITDFQGACFRVKKLVCTGLINMHGTHGAVFTLILEDGGTMLPQEARRRHGSAEGVARWRHDDDGGGGGGVFVVAAACLLACLLAADAAAVVVVVAVAFAMFRCRWGGRIRNAQLKLQI